MGGNHLGGAPTATGYSLGPPGHLIAPLPAQALSHLPLSFYGVPWASSEYHRVQLMYAEKFGLENALPLLLHPMFADAAMLAVGELPTTVEWKSWRSSLGWYYPASAGTRFVPRSSDIAVDSDAEGTRVREAIAMPDCPLRRPQLSSVIATLSHGPIEATFEVDHFDGDCQNNAAYNLDVKAPEVHYKKSKEERTGMGHNLYAVSSSAERDTRVRHWEMAVVFQAFGISQAVIVEACMATDAVTPGGEERAENRQPAGAVRLPATDGLSARAVYFRYENEQDFPVEQWRPVVLCNRGETATNGIISDWGRASHNGDSRSRRMRWTM
ncbi:hypothetical protein I4F81_010627 [Pyropia yezoensis]|uniref:Uncharacterized protein n=1 Tax=Pyropia yezoensis TaxID=2788 RepID=A0ACC3CD79_PYRYE|nr:hypothetical protein I4F81_010627 [Neopyropia yezoensis]